MSMFTSVALLATLIGLVALGCALARTVRDDGLGHRTPPGSEAAGTAERTW